MTLAQLIAALQALDVPGETEVRIHQRSSAWLVVECQSVTMRLAAAKCMRSLFKQAHAQSKATARDVDKAIDDLRTALNDDSGDC